MPGRRFAVVGTLFAALLLAPSARADTIQVTSADDGISQPGCSLREAIDSFEGMGGLDDCNRLAAPGTNTVSFAPGMSGSTIPLDGTELDISSAINIVGPGADDLVVDANDLSRALLVTGAIGVEISGLTLRDGVAPAAGGVARGGCVFNDATLTLEDVRVTDCETEVAGNGDQFAQGGGVYSAGTLTLDGVTLDDNSAIANNIAGDGTSAYARGGGLFADSGLTTIVDSTISGNQASSLDDDDGEAQSAAGAFLVSGFSIESSTVSGNVATTIQDGGTGGPAYSAALHTLASGTIDASTIAENVTNLNGSGPTFSSAVVAQGVAGIVTLRSSTLASNGPSILTGLAGVNLFVVEGTASLTNNILAEPSGDGINCLALGTITTGGYNTDNSPAGPSCFDPPAATDMALDPLLDSAGLADNGGPTETIALQATSPAIDAGSNAGSLDEDQRGLGRPADFSAIPNAAGGNGTDIGAFEVQLACAGQATPATVCPSGGGSTTPPTPTATGERAKALKKCKKVKDKKKRKKCKKKAKKKPV